jgi:hypothetical protein
MKRTLVLFALSAGLILSCSTPTQIIAKWKDPQVQENRYKHIFVAGLTQNAVAKHAFEGNMGKELEAAGVKCTKGTDLFPYQFTKENRPDKEMILSKVREAGSDAILTFALVKQKEEVHYVPGSVYAPPAGPYGGYYGSFGGYYGYYGNRMYDPGYYTQDDVYFIESNLYDTRSEKLIWSAQSETYNPVDVESFSKEVTHTFMRQLVKDSLLAVKRVN